MRKGEIVKIIKAHIPQLENRFFLISSKGEEEVMLEDGTLSIESVLYGYPSALMPNGSIVVISDVRTSLLKKSFIFEHIATCFYTFIPQITQIIDEIENQSEEAQ